MLVEKSAPFLAVVAAATVSEVFVALESEAFVEEVTFFLQAPHKKMTAASAGKDRNRIIVPIYSKLGANRQLVMVSGAFNFFGEQAAFLSVISGHRNDDGVLVPTEQYTDHPPCRLSSAAG